MNRDLAAPSRPRGVGSGGLGRALCACLAAAALSLTALAAQARTIIVGGKAFTEQYVLAEITKQMLERAGIEAQTRVGYATDKLRQAQLAGTVDVAWDYTWTGYRIHHGFTQDATPDEALRIVREADLENGLVWLARSRVKNSFALAVNLDFAAEHCIHSITDLAQAIRNGLKVKLASDQECFKREDCLIGAQRAYDFTVPKDQIDVMNVADTHEALRERKAEVAVVYTTDGKIPAYDLELLEDPKNTFAAFFLTPVVTTKALEEQPKLREVMDKISRAMDLGTSQDLHYRVDIVGQSVEQVARYFITSKGL